jgi:DNA-binding transcriptional MerR regulator
MTPQFDDGKAPDALRTIGEVSRGLGIRQHVLRYWEEQFPMLRPIKRSGGRRYYRPQDIALIAEIDRMVHEEGLTLRGARQALESSAPRTRRRPPPQVARAVGAGDELGTVSIDDTVMGELQTIRADLAEALAKS